MAQLSAAEVAGYARAGGLTDPMAIATAVAIAGWAGSPHPGESGGDPNAMGDTRLETGVWGPSLGLWQIRSLRNDAGTGRPRDPRQLTDPMFNARSMVTISKGGTDWTPWSVYTNGTYRRNLDAAKAVAAGKVPDVAGGGVGGVLGKVGGGLDAIGKLTGAVLDPGFWRRVGLGVLGVWLIIFGAAIIFRDSLAGAANLAATGPVGVAAKVGAA